MPGKLKYQNHILKYKKYLNEYKIFFLKRNIFRNLKLETELAIPAQMHKK